MTTSYRSLTLLSVSVFALLAYNFLGAAWTPAPANPPNDNVAVPINVSSTTQVKNGRLNLRYGDNMAVATSVVMFRTNGNAMGNIFAAGSQTWSPLYCNAQGENCFRPGEVPSGKRCADGKYLRGFTDDGGVICAKLPEAGSSCVEESMFVQACQLDPQCPSGWTPAGPITRGAGCEQGASYRVLQCTKLVCDGGTSTCRLGETKNTSYCVGGNVKGGECDGTKGWVELSRYSASSCSGDGDRYNAVCARVACIE